MGSHGSTKVDPFRSCDCLILNTSAQVKQSKSYSLCCFNFIAEYINSLSNPANETKKNSNESALENGVI